MSLLLASDFARKMSAVRYKAAAEGILFEVTQAWRSVTIQEDLLRCWEDPECRKRRGIVVRPAAPGWSYHNWARAWDFKVIKRPDGMTVDEAHDRVGAIAEAEGLRYGGNFRDKNGSPDPDRVHVDDGKAYTIYTARSLFDESDLVEIQARLGEARVVDGSSDNSSPGSV